MCDWLKLLIFPNLLIIHSFGSSVASHRAGGCSPPFFIFIFWWVSWKGNWNCFFLLKPFMIPPVFFFWIQNSFSVLWWNGCWPPSIICGFKCYTKTGSGKWLCMKDLMGSKWEKGTEKRKSRFCGCKTYVLGHPLGFRTTQRQEVSIHKSWSLSTVFGIII